MDATYRVLLGDDLVNFIFLGSLLLLVFFRFMLLSKHESIFNFRGIVGDSENFTFYIVICNLVYTIILTLVLLPFFNYIIPFYNFEIIKFLILLLILIIYQVVSAALGIGFFIILGKKDYYETKYKYRYIFLFIKLFFAIILCTIVYYTGLPKEYISYLVLGILAILFIVEWFWILFFIKKQIKLPGYYDFLYLCTFEILPMLCLIKLVFLGDKL